MTKTFLSAFPWDLCDEDMGAVLDRLRGEIGVTGVSVCVASPPVVQFRVHDATPRIFRTRGGLFFQPDTHRYENTRCKPIVSGWVKRRDPLARIANACEKRQMELRIAVSVAATGRVALRHPEMAAKNVFDAESHLSVCLANSDIQTYLCDLVADLTSRFRAAALILADYETAWWEAYSGDFLTATPVGRLDRRLLATCFCESCQQGATGGGVDVAKARRHVRVEIARMFDETGSSIPSRVAISAADSPWGEYVRWRGEMLSSLLGRVKEACACEVLLDRTGAAGCRHSCEAIDFRIPAGVITGLVDCGGVGDALCTQAHRNELRIPPRFAVGPRGPELVGLAADASKLGFAGVTFDQYGLLPEACLTLVRQAVRFVRRASAV